jgi:hypothetical protein
MPDDREEFSTSAVCFLFLHFAMMLAELDVFILVVAKLTCVAILREINGNLTTNAS